MANQVTGRSLGIVRIALIVSVVIYGAVLSFALRGVETPPFEQSLKNPLVMGLYAIAGSTFLLTWSLSGKRRERLPGEAPPAPGSAVMTEGEARARVVHYALFESVAIYGVLAAFIAGDVRLFVPLAGLALVGLLLRKP